MRESRPTPARAALLAGLVAGTIDIFAAALINQAGLLVILQAIASGLIGRSAFAGGAGTALLGLLLQWVMSILIAAIYLLVTAPLPRMRRHWLLTGTFAGVVIFVVMNGLVVPLSAAPFAPPFNVQALVATFTPYRLFTNLIAMIVFGLIIALFAAPVGPPGSELRNAASKLGY
jgi:uncharacterized membrane protein YagU involved in acid resistance